MGLRSRALILALIEKMDDKKSWCGETHIQKCTYFLQEMLGVPLGFDFILYKHGPYSFDLHDELTAMRADDFLMIRIRNFSYGPSLVLSTNSSLLLRRFSDDIGGYQRHIDFVAHNLSCKKVAELERLGTAWLVTKESGFIPLQERSVQVCSLKPHISPEEALDAVSVVDNLHEQAQKMGIVINE